MNTSHRNGTSPRSSSQPAVLRDGAIQIAAWQRARRKFLKVFPDGFQDATYLAWERDYKWGAHQEWESKLGASRFAHLCKQGKFKEIADTAVRIESGRSLLFSFEKMALRDAVRSEDGARIFAEGLRVYLYGNGALADRFENWCMTVASLPRKQTRVLTWPLVTVFGFIAQPGVHIFLKPLAMRAAARKLHYEFPYRPRPGWGTYKVYLQMAKHVRHALANDHPRDMIDVQSFLWVLGADEYN
jgi:hypothetical protein